jgi:hypothetical protein
MVQDKILTKVDTTFLKQKTLQSFGFAGFAIFSSP